ncbi:MAG TPA: SGNH/GDSL hydrolase family protein [Clostridiales bacterium]|nr:SGNH/GDSL hydrolase family protein [Clostridiales bacterium]
MNALNSKTLFFLGSSVTYGSDGVSFVDFIAERNNCTCIKAAVSGTTLADNGSTSYVKRLHKDLDPKRKCDHFICQLSTNDASQGVPLGKISETKDINTFDTTTIIGAIEYIISYAYKTWKCPISFYTGTYFESKKYQDMVDILYKLKEKWNIGIIDLWNNEEMRKVAPDDYKKYMVNPIHPALEGYKEWWTPVFEEYLNTYHK